MKKLLCLILLAPLAVFSQTVVETVKLKNDKYATLYDDGTWMYTSSPVAAGRANTTDDKPPISTVRSSPVARPVSSPAPSSSYSSACGARTKAGGSCRRMVKGGGRCWQH